MLIWSITLKVSTTRLCDIMYAYTLVKYTHTKKQNTWEVFPLSLIAVHVVLVIL